MRYWDTSALMPLFVSERRSSEIRGLLERDPLIVTWWGTPVECYSALWRFRRSRALNESDFPLVKERMDHTIAELNAVSPSVELRARALRLIATHPLAAGDSLQLAAAILWVQDHTMGAAFVSLDDRLRSAASAEGFSVLP